MEREILFRGKCVDNGEWVEGDYSHDTDLETSYISGYDYYTDGDGLQRNLYGYEIIPETRGEYTGLTDKNGKKIFEGDILDLSALMITDFGVVKCGEYKDCDMSDDYPCGHVGFYVDIEEMNYKRDYVRKDILFFVSKCKVIGNIHDNPEILEVKHGNNIGK